MSSESPWRTLAERLGMLPKNHRPGDPALILLGNKWTDPYENADAQDLLIGRALRVAVERHDEGLSVKQRESDEMVIDLVCYSYGDSRALAALELLDAVGYELTD